MNTELFISRLENGTANPSLRTLEKLADGLDMKLEIKFVPKHKNINELFADYTDDYKSTEIDRGDPVGKETW